MSETTEALPAVIPTETTEALPAVVPVEITASANAPLLGGAVDFEITPGDRGEPWHASNGKIGLTVFPSSANTAPSKRLWGEPALLFKNNKIHMPMGKNAKVPFTHRTQTLIGELNGVFVHLIERDGLVAIVVADHRLED